MVVLLFLSFLFLPLLSSSLSLSLSLCFYGSVFFLHWSVKYEREIEKNRREGGREGGRLLLFLPFLCLCFCFNLPPHLFLCFFLFSFFNTNIIISNDFYY